MIYFSFILSDWLHFIVSQLKLWVPPVKQETKFSSSKILSLFFKVWILCLNKGYLLLKSKKTFNIIIYPDLNYHRMHTKYEIIVIEDNGRELEWLIEHQYALSKGRLQGSLFVGRVSTLQKGLRTANF